MRQTTPEGLVTVEGRCEAQALVSTKLMSFLARAKTETVLVPLKECLETAVEG